MTPNQVNLGLGGLLAGSLLTGVLSWAVPVDAARWFTAIHAGSGYALVLLAPLKVWGPVRSGFRRRRWSRWLSAVFGVLIVATIGLGLAHATGIWVGVGQWSALWTHVLLGFTSVPLLVWHVTTRPVRLRPVDVSRREVLSAGAVAVGAAVAVGTQELVLDAVGGAGGRRAGTGSHETASFDPDRLPVVSWLDDTTPASVDWSVAVEGRPVDLATLAARAVPLEAALDCTGGWWSTQRWDVVPLADLVSGHGRSIAVTSITGYQRLFSMADAAQVYVCTGYDGRRLQRGHGAPLRIVAPGRRGPWWVKWVASIETSNRPAWLQLPFPPT
jgi:hypothetical protein